MGLFDDLWKRNSAVDEAIEDFKDKGTKPIARTQRGEGWETLEDLAGFSNVGLQSFNMFYRSLANREYENEVQRMFSYREMARMPEVGDVIEDATNESTQLDEAGKIIHLEIIDPKLSQNENIVRNIEKEFNELFYNKFDFEDVIWDMFKTYMVDGRVYYERVIDTQHPERGIINIKKLPTETMDYLYDPLTGKILYYFQYLRTNPRRPLTLEDAQKRDDVIIFEPEQIGFINYGIYGMTRYQIEGYLEKAVIPYNQLKLLETSVVIYRIVRAPERLVFRIDTGNMPRDKALKYVEKIKNKMTKKQTYNPQTGALTHEPEVLSILENYYMPQSADGRGSQIESVGGNAAGFSELDDVYYFARKLYRALKYPLSRVSAGQEKREADIMFGGSNTGEISRDEIKWAKFLERQQRRICDDFTSMFLLHLDFRGLKKLYELDRTKIKVNLNKPSNYKEQMDQNFLETRFNNYSTLADRPEMSKYYLMKKYLKWSDDEIDANVKGMKKDKELGFQVEEAF